MKLYAGADLGGTNFRVALREAGAARLLASAAIPAQGDWSAEALVQRTGDLLRDLLAEQAAADPRVLGLGFGLTGDINPDAGTCHSMKRFPRLEGVPLADLLQRSLGAPTRILNDGLSATLAELRAGVGRDVRDFVLVTLGTGIGGGVVLEGALLAGRSGRIGKVGHQIIDADGPMHCHCGLRGCWQSLAGKEGVIVRARAAAARHPGSRLAEAVRGGDVDLQQVAELAAAGDGASREVVRETGRYVGIGLANLVKILAPERLVVGGGIAERNPLLLDAIQETVREYAIKPYQAVCVVPTAVGKDAGVLGATFLAESACV